MDGCLGDSTMSASPFLPRSLLRDLEEEYELHQRNLADLAPNSTSETNTVEKQPLVVETSARVPLAELPVGDLPTASRTSSLRIHRRDASYSSDEENEEAENGEEIDDNDCSSIEAALSRSSSPRLEEEEHDENDVVKSLNAPPPSPESQQSGQRRASTDRLTTNEDDVHYRRQMNAVVAELDATRIQLRTVLQKAEGLHRCVVVRCNSDALKMNMLCTSIDQLAGHRTKLENNLHELMASASFMLPELDKAKERVKEATEHHNKLEVNVKRLQNMIHTIKSELGTVNAQLEIALSLRSDHEMEMRQFQVMLSDTVDRAPAAPGGALSRVDVPTPTVVPTIRVSQPPPQRSSVILAPPGFTDHPSRVPLYARRSSSTVPIMGPGRSSAVPPSTKAAVEPNPDGHCTAKNVAPPATTTTVRPSEVSQISEQAPVETVPKEHLQSSKAPITAKEEAVKPQLAEASGGPVGDAKPKSGDNKVGGDLVTANLMPPLNTSSSVRNPLAVEGDENSVVPSPVTWSRPKTVHQSSCASSVADAERKDLGGSLSIQNFVAIRTELRKILESEGLVGTSMGEMINAASAKQMTPKLRQTLHSVNTVLNSVISAKLPYTQYVSFTHDLGVLCKKWPELEPLVAPFKDHQVTQREANVLKEVNRG